jgi:CubicO group peptidase (beta-lactamase class C family)
MSAPARPRRASLLFIAAAVALPMVGLRAQSATDRALRTVDSLAAVEFARDSVGSLTVGVVVDTGIVWTRSYGWADMETRRAADRRTGYRIASITKLFTALMLQQLEAAGTVRLDDPVERVYPAIRSTSGYATAGPPITFRQLATMTSGLAREPDNVGPFWTGPAARWEATLAQALPHTRVEAAPGARFGYSNVGYAILGAALAEAAGMPYLRWQEERILRPLGMRETSFEVDARLAGRLATGYVIRPDRSVDDGEAAAREAREGRGYKVPNGGIVTTVDDMGRFVRFALGRGPASVLAPAQLDRGYAAATAALGDTGMTFGYGVMAERRDGRTWFGQEGGMLGYSAMLSFDRVHGVGVIVLRSALGGRARHDRLAAAALRALVEARRTRTR